MGEFWPDPDEFRKKIAAVVPVAHDDGRLAPDGRMKVVVEKLGDHGEGVLAGVVDQVASYLYHPGARAAIAGADGD